MAAEPPPGTAKTLCGPGNGGSWVGERIARALLLRSARFPSAGPRRAGRTPAGPGATPLSPLQHGRKALNSALATWQRQPRLGALDSRPSVDRAERALLPGAPPAFLLSCALSVHVVTHFSIGLLVFSLFRKIFFKY